MPEWLLDWLGSGLAVKFLLGKFPRYSRHVLRGPCKDIPILTEELDELAFLFAAQSGPDDAKLAWLRGVQDDFLAIFGGLERGLVIRSLGLRARHGHFHLALGHGHYLIELAPLCIYDQGISKLGSG